MPNKHAALKAIRKDRNRRARNQAVHAELRTITKRLLALLNAKQANEAQTLLRQVASAYDRAAVKGVIHRNAAARAKSRFTQRLARLQPASS